MMKGKDRVVFNAIISGLAMNGHVRATFGVFGQLEKYEIQPDGNTFVGLLCGCTHAGLVNDGRRYFDSMSYVFSLSPTIEHYGCMVDLLSRAGLLVEAHNLIKSMPMKPNTIVLGILLGRCRRIGLLAAIPLTQPILCRKLNRSNVCIESPPNKSQHPIRTNNSVKRYHHKTNNHQHSTLLHLKEEKANDPQSQ
ncbi:hypothetical protein AHAS_Ahas17G0265600 [Arachis hypogaea]